MPEAHSPWFELFDACAGEGCPICRLSAARVAMRIDNLLWEHVSDREFRATFRKAGGFCRDHSRDLEKFRDGQAVAILHRDILADRLAVLKKGRAFKPKALCPICTDRDKVEKNYLTVLADGDEKLRSAFEASTGLCVPHFGLLVTKLKAPKWLRAWQEKKYQDLIRRSDVFIDYSAYGREADFKSLSEADRTVWKELATTLRGK